MNWRNTILVAGVGAFIGTLVAFAILWMSDSVLVQVLAITGSAVAWGAVSSRFWPVEK